MFGASLKARSPLFRYLRAVTADSTLLLYLWSLLFLAFAHSDATAVPDPGRALPRTSHRLVATVAPAPGYLHNRSAARVPASRLRAVPDSERCLACIWDQSSAAAVLSGPRVAVVWLREAPPARPRSILTPRFSPRFSPSRAPPVS